MSDDSSDDQPNLFMPKKNVPVVEIEEVTIHWSAIGRLLLGLMTMPFLLMTLGSGLLGAFEPGHRMVEDYNWLASNWMYLLLGMSMLITPLFILQRQPESPEWCSCTLALLYCVHLFEEHALDISGRRYAGASHLAESMSCTLDVSECLYLLFGNPDAHPLFPTHEDKDKQTKTVFVKGNCGMDQDVIMWMNLYTVLGMLIVMPVFALPFESRYYALVQNAMFVAVNALSSHIVPALVTQKYNPGLLQSMFMNAPFAIYVLFQMHARNRVTIAQLLVAFAVCGFPAQNALLTIPLKFSQDGVFSKAQQHLWFACLPLITLIALVQKPPASLEKTAKKALRRKGTGRGKGKSGKVE